MDVPKHGNSTFRFSENDLFILNSLVETMKKRRGPHEWGPPINKTNVIRTLLYDAWARVEREERDKFEKECAGKTTGKKTTGKKKGKVK